jgi:hypothetical protein
MLAEKVGQIAEVAAKDVKTQLATGNTYDESDSDSSSDSSSFMSVGNFEDVVEDLKVYCGSLMELNPSLENPATDLVVMEESNSTLTNDLFSVSEPARPFVLIIKDRFPSTDADLVKKLGEANWQRRERLSTRLAYNQRKSTDSSRDSDAASDAETALDPMRDQAVINHGRPSVIRSSIGSACNYQSITTASNFSEPSIFDRDSARIPPHHRRRSVAESLTSFATSVAEGDENGQRRFPSLPSNHDFDSSFQCKICGDLLNDISNRADWK